MCTLLILYLLFEEKYLRHAIPKVLYQLSFLPSGTLSCHPGPMRQQRPLRPDSESQRPHLLPNHPWRASQQVSRRRQDILAVAPPSHASLLLQLPNPLTSLTLPHILLRRLLACFLSHHSNIACLLACRGIIACGPGFRILDGFA